MRSSRAVEACSNRVSKLLWGPALEPERYDLVCWLFLRLFGAIYLAAFASLGVQILGLVGSAGILPLTEYLDAAHRALGGAAYRLLPTLFWLNASDTALVAGTVVGAFAGTAGDRRLVDAARAHRPRSRSTCPTSTPDRIS